MIRFLQKEGQTQKILLAFFLGLICLTMVLYLVPGFNDAFNSSSDPNVIAKVGNREITAQEVTRVATNLVRRQFPRGAPPQLVSLFQDQAMQQLVVQRVFLNEAHRLGLDATDQELRAELEHGPYADQLFPEGKFIGREAYESWVQASTGLNVPRFEELTKESITITKLISVVQGGATVSPAAIKDEFIKANTKVKIDYAYFTLDQIAKSVQPSDSELKAYYEKSQDMLKDAIPEQRKAKYVLIDGANLPNVKVTDEDLKSYYQQHQDEFREKPSSKVRHILISTQDAGNDQKKLDAAKAKAEDVLKQLKAGGDWKTLAKKYSDDPGSKDKGGEYPPFAPGQTAPEFDKAIFTGPVGELQGPIKTQFGYHIIQVQQRNEAKLKTLDEVKSQIQPIVARQKATAEAQQLANTVQAQARTEGIDKAASAHNLQVMNTDFFSRNSSLPGVGNAPAFMDAVFSAKTPSTPVAVQVPQGWAVVQATESKPPRTPTFEEAKSQLAARYSQERAQSLLRQKTQELADKAHQLHNLKEAAKQLNANFKTSDLVTPTQQVPDLGVLGNVVDVSAMNKGEISNAVAAGGNGAVIALVDKQAPSDDDFAKNKDQYRDQLLQQKREELLQIYVSSLKDKMEKDGKIKIFQKNLERISKNTAE